jgi:hypothetical protein
VRVDGELDRVRDAVLVDERLEIIAEPVEPVEVVVRPLRVQDVDDAVQGDSASAGFLRNGESDAFVENPDRKGALAVSRAARDPQLPGLDHVAARRLEHVDQPARAPGHAFSNP